MTSKLEEIWWTRTMAKPLIILVLLGLVCTLPVAQSRPRDISEHRGLYDDIRKSSQSNNGEYNISNSTQKSEDSSLGKYLDSMTNSLNGNRTVEVNKYSNKYERYVSSNEADDDESKDDLFRKRINQDTDKQLVKSSLNGRDNYRYNAKMQEQREIDSKTKTQHKGQQRPKHKKNKIASNTNLLRFDFLDKKDIQVNTPDVKDASELEKNASVKDKKNDDSHILRHEDLAKKEKKDSLFDLNSFVKENPDLDKNTGIIEDDIMYQRDQGYQSEHRSDGEFNHFGHQMRYGSNKESDLDDSIEDDDTDDADDGKRGKDENKQLKQDGYNGYYYRVHEKEHGGSLSGKDESERRTLKEYENSQKKQESGSDEETKVKGSEEHEDEGEEEKDEEKNEKEEKKEDEEKKDEDEKKKQKKEDEDEVEKQDGEKGEESDEKGEGEEEEEEEKEKKQKTDGDGSEKEEEDEKEEEEEKETDKDKVHIDAEPKIDAKQSTSGQRQYQFNEPFNPYAINVEDIYIESRPIESCVKDFDCPPGRICKFGFCICGPPILCMGHKKPVCGSDGFMYPSHCELHRTACMKREHIWIDSDTNCMGQGQGQSQGQAETGGKKEGMIGEATNYKTKENDGDGGGDGASSHQSENEAEVDENQHSSDNDGSNLSSEADTGGATVVNGKKQVSDKGQKDQKEMVSVHGNVQKGESGISFDAAKENLKQQIPEGNGEEMEKHYVDGRIEDSLNTSRNGESAVERQPVLDSALDSQRGSGSGMPETINPSKSTGQSKDKDNFDSNGKGTSSLANQETGEITALDKNNETDKASLKVKPSGEGNGLDVQQEGSDVLGRDSVTQTSDEQKKKDAELSVPEDEESIVSGTTTSAAKEENMNGQFQQENEKQGMNGKNGISQGVKNSAVIGAMVPTSGLGVEDKGKGKTNQTNQVSDENKQHVEDAMLNIKEGGEEIEKEVSQEVDGEQQGQEVQEEEEESGYQGDSPIFDKVQDPLFCTPQVLLRFKADVLRYHCVLFNEEHCDNESKDERQYVATEMFKYFDKDFSGFVEKEELWMLQLQENIDKMSSVCSLLDLVAMNDQGDKDGKLTTDEFIKAFDIPDEVFEPKITTIPTLATVGNDLEIRCGIVGESSDFVWQKSGMDLSLIDVPEIHVFKDGTLYIEGVDIHHIGNYSCHQRNKPAARQINVLSVIMKPKVKIESLTTVYPDQSEVIISCHADGLPKPEVSWEFNGSPLDLSSEKFHLDTYQHTLTIRQAHYQDDTGSYKCVAVNKVGKAEDAVSIFIDDPKITAKHIDSVSSRESFVVFHDNGYTIYEPHHCLTQRHVLGDFGNFHFIPEELDDVPSMCESDGPCVWGSAVTVKGRFVYVSQPQQNRVLVVDATETLNPRQIVKTDRAPVQLHYVEANDEVWVLCWNGEEDYGTKTIIIIREASKDVQHHIIHMQPIGNRFDQVRNMFLPPHSDLNQDFKYGYAMHNEQQGLFKVDLQQKKYVKAIDFSPYNCVPQALAFIPIGGQVIIQCQQKTVSSQSDILLHMDTITDVTVANLSKSGTPFVTPDSRRMAVVDKSTGRITVYLITDMGEIQEIFEVTTGSSVNDVIFHPADLHFGYDLYVTSRERSVIFSVSLENGKVETIKDVGDIDTIPKLPWLKKTSRFISGNVFSNSLSVITKSALVILNDKYKDVQCRFNDLENPTVIAYANPN
ncbi:hypothetical protein CHS0354_025530 [Potamilus streckersoni]|uniref:Follistatin-related protein 5 n=1 Tax=Potamilus streckersoni TaxID=2493646 RepID=A0AAE0VXI7_9BIVA|nr:hypothetical protein CHS0354_025530 [Potamilus streckersoni]